jgi:Uma2 family endonuclease
VFLPTYWLVDPGENCLEEYRLEQGGFVLVSMAESNSVFKPVIFPELEINLDQVWA